MSDARFFYRDYIWRKGFPEGKVKLLAPEGICYKIVADPYGKRICIERYCDELFEKTTYDSLLLDYRTLMTELPPEWERSPLQERNIIRDPYHRILWIESFDFKDNECRYCFLHSSHGVLLSQHKLFYKRLGDPFDGVILYDAEGKPVLYKAYTVDEESGLFTDLIEESWDTHTLLQRCPPLGTSINHSASMDTIHRYA